MSRKREFCICGYETRSDYMKKHVQSCSAVPIINKLKQENKFLQTQVYILQQVESHDTRDEIIYLREQLELKGRIIEEKDNEIRELLKNQNVTNNYNVTNVLNIFPFGQEPLVERNDALLLLKKPSDSVPMYIKMKHFKDGLSNVRIHGNSIEVVEESESGEKKWVVRDKHETLFRLTDTNLEEFHQEYGSNDFMWKRWFITRGYNRDGYEKTHHFKDLLKKVENVFINSS